MANLIPLTGNPTKAPVLLLDANQPFAEIQECAERRLGAARDLLQSLACLKIEAASGHDISNLADAACLLLEDASDLFKAAGQAARREVARHE